MRVFAKVYGVGQHKKGVSKKTGQPYDFVEVSIGYAHQMFDGMKCETVAIEAETIGDRVIAPGDDLDIVIHQANFKTYVDAII